MKTLIVVRHAHRDKPVPDSDNGLSQKGRKQAQRISSLYRAVHGGAKGKPAILSSPKKRCRETMAPLARAVRAPVLISGLLDEGGRISTRVSAFLKEWARSPEELTVVCSHGDWIPVFFKKAIGVELDLEKGAWAELECDETGCLRLRSLIQDLKPFK
jgi:broad specificity phosphatase PhoE